jgi:hypothetical protein
MKKWLWVIVLFLAIPCLAQDTTTFQWDLSISEPLGAGGGYRVYCSKQSQSYVNPDHIVSTVAPAVNTTTIETSTYRGRYHCIATAFIIDNSEEFESDWSNEVTAVFKPHPPTNFEKVVAIAAYPVRKTIDLFAGLFGKKNLRIVD